MILTNGCSFTEGYDLPTTELSWPHCLGQQLKLSVKNLARGGASNDRIARTLRESLVTSTPDLVVVGWTDFGRNELSHQDGFYVRATPSVCLAECEKQPSNLIQLYENWAKFNYNIWINYRNWIYNVLFFQDYLIKKNIPFLFFSAFNKNYIDDFVNETDASLELADQSYQWRDRSKYAPQKTTHREWQELVSLCKQIDLDRWVLHNKHTMQSYLNTKQYLTDANGHFFADGHLCWSKVIFEQIS